MPQPDTAPPPADPPTLLALLISARRAGDGSAERTALRWLRDLGIIVTFGDRLQRGGEVACDA